MSKSAYGLLFVVFALTAFAISEPLIHEWIRGNEDCYRYKGCQSDMPDTAALFGAIIGLLALGTVAAGLLVRTMVTNESEKRVEAAERHAAEAVEDARNYADEASRHRSSIESASVMHELSIRDWSEYFELTHESPNVESGHEHEHDPRGWPEIRDGIRNVRQRNQARIRLESAISLARGAYQRRDEFGNEPEYILVRMQIANSLLYYLAEQGDPGDRIEAESLLIELNKNRESFPELQPFWDDTIAHLRMRWPKRKTAQ